jgi:hypothetical protein
MTNDELQVRLQRIYAAVDAVIETNIRKAKPVVRSDENISIFFQDFRGGLSDAEMENMAYSFIHNLANLRDHIRNWMKKNGRNPNQIDTFISTTLPVAIIQDLSNNDKHGYPPRNLGFSGKSPKLVNVNRIMQLNTGTEPGSSVLVTFTPSCKQRVSGSGSATLVITGDILDIRGNVIGNLHIIQNDALNAWEGFLRSLGLLK